MAFTMRRLWYIKLITNTLAKSLRYFLMKANDFVAFFKTCAFYFFRKDFLYHRNISLYFSLLVYVSCWTCPFYILRNNSSAHQNPLLLFLVFLYKSRLFFSCIKYNLCLLGYFLIELFFTRCFKLFFEFS